MTVARSTQEYAEEWLRDLGDKDAERYVETMGDGSLREVSDLFGRCSLDFLNRTRGAELLDHANAELSHRQM